MSLSPTQVSQVPSLAVSGTLRASGQLYSFDSAYTHAVVVNSGASALSASSSADDAPFATLQSGTTVVPLANGQVWLASLGRDCAVSVTPASDARYQRNAAAFGVLPGGTDIGVALNAAIASVSVAGGGTIVFDGGTYATSIPIVWKSNVRLQGAGSEATVIQASVGFPDNRGVVESDNYQSLTGKTQDGTNGYGIVNAGLRGLTIGGNRAAQSPSAYFHGLCYIGYNCTFDDIIVEDCPGVGIWTEFHNSSIQTNVSPMRGIHSRRNGCWGWMYEGPHDNHVEDVQTSYNGSPQGAAAFSGWNSGFGGWFLATRTRPDTRIAVNAAGQVAGLAAMGSGYQSQTTIVWSDDDGGGYGFAQTDGSGAVTGILVPVNMRRRTGVTYTTAANTLRVLNGGFIAPTTEFVGSLSFDASLVPTLTITTAGAGYAKGPTLTPSGGAPSRACVYVPLVENGRCTRAIQCDAGAGYASTSDPVLFAVTGSGSGAYAVATDVSGGGVNSVTFGHPGSLLNLTNTATPLAMASNLTGGSGATFTPNLNVVGEALSYTVVPGTGYSPAPTTTTVATTPTFTGGFNSGLADSTGTKVTRFHSWGDQGHALRAKGGAYIQHGTFENSGSSAVIVECRDAEFTNCRSYSNGATSYPSGRNNPFFTVGTGGLVGGNPRMVGMTLGYGSQGAERILIDMGFDNCLHGGIVVANVLGGINVVGRHFSVAGLPFDVGHTTAQGYTSAQASNSRLIDVMNLSHSKARVDSAGVVQSVPVVADGAGEFRSYVRNWEAILNANIPASAFRVSRSTGYGSSGASIMEVTSPGSLSFIPVSGQSVDLWLAGGFSARHRLMGTGQFRWGKLAGTNDPTTGFTGGMTSATVDTNGTDQRGGIVFVTNGTPAAAGATIFTVTFKSPYSIAPFVIVQGRDLASQTLGLYVNGTSTTAFTVAAQNAPAASTTYSFTYWVMG